MTARPNLLFYCQHSLGLGHLVRSLALTEALRQHFQVTLLNGGRMPTGATVPRGVNVVNLPPLGHDDSYQLVSHDPDIDVETAKARRAQIIGNVLELTRPHAVFVELYPFGRKKFAFELEPLLERCATMTNPRPKVLCSLRDILVSQRRDQARHDERAATAINAWFDAVLVHADPGFARLEESFRPQTALRVPVHYTGFVAPAPIQRGRVDRSQRVIVSAGGGMVGEPLFRTAVGAAPLVWAEAGLRTMIVAGPFLPDPAWSWLQRQAGPFTEVVRRVDDLAAHIAGSAVSVSQCGYNTTMDLLRAGTPAVVVPYSEGKEDEQQRRAERLAGLGALATLSAATLDAATLAAAVCARRNESTPPVTLDLGGAENTAELTAQIAGVAPVGAGT